MRYNPAALIFHLMYIIISIAIINIINILIIICSVRFTNGADPSFHAISGSVGRGAYMFALVTPFPFGYCAAICFCNA